MAVRISKSWMIFTPSRLRWSDLWYYSFLKRDITAEIVHASKFGGFETVLDGNKTTSTCVVLSLNQKGEKWLDDSLGVESRSFLAPIVRVYRWRAEVSILCWRSASTRKARLPAIVVGTLTIFGKVEWINTGGQRCPVCKNVLERVRRRVESMNLLYASCANFEGLYESWELKVDSYSYFPFNAE